MAKVIFLCRRNGRYACPYACLLSTQAWMGTGIPGGMPDCLLAYRADGCRPDQETDV
ncbi:hypothetical protein NXX77_26440 [Phocaeicola dorei]|nr:hypothetical protein [Phocaeicola dorei]